MGIREFLTGSLAGPTEMAEDMDCGGRQPDVKAQFVGFDPDAPKAQPEQPEVNSRGEDGQRRYDNDRRGESHEELRRPGAPVLRIAGVVANEPVAGGSHLQGQRRYEQKSKQEMLRQPPPDAKNCYSHEGKE